MAKEKVNWDDIPSLDGLKVDWEFEPENPLGKRAWVRMIDRDLYQLLGVKSIPARVVAKNADQRGLLVDIAQSGVAVLLNEQLTTNQQVKIGILLGKQKIVSRAIIRNVRSEMGKFRTGMEFVDLNKESESYIIGLISSKVYDVRG